MSSPAQPCSVPLHHRFFAPAKEARKPGNGAPGHIPGVVGTVATLLLCLVVSLLAAAPSFAANNPVPYIDLVSPVSVNPGATNVTLTVKGTGFLTSSLVEWNGNELPTTYLSAQELTASVPNSYVAAVGLGSVTVVSPTPGGGTSNIFYVPVASHETSTAFQQATGSPVTVGSGPEYITSGDFNGDGKPDLATANSGGNSVSILLGNGDGTFTAKPALTTGSSPQWITAGDFNHDGKLDLAVTNESSNTVSVFLGNGDGTFTLKSSPSAGTEPYAITTADLNADGNLDLVVTNENGTSTVLLGNGDGTFTLKSTLTVGSEPQQAVVGDFNEDGILDIAVANEGDNDVSVLLGVGDGTFHTQTTFATSGTGEPIGLITADFNGDGHLDLAAIDVTDVAILLGNGAGSFTLSQNADGSGSSLYTGVTGDFNGDGKLDLAVSDNGSGKAVLMLGNGNGTFGTPTTYSAGTNPFGVATSDFNGDGGLDLAFANQGSNNVSIYLQLLPIALSPTSLTFPSQTLNTTSASQAVTVKNNTVSSLTFTSITITGTDASDFSETNTCGSSLGASGTCTINVTFTPATAGSLTATLTVTDSGTNSPQTLALTGTGQGPFPIVSLSPTSLTFTSQAVGTSSSFQVVTLTNTGTATLDISNIQLTGADTGDFSMVDDCGTTLAASNNCTVNVTFNPTAAGTRTAFITFTDNTSNSPQDVGLTGTATKGTPSVSWSTPSAITYGTALSSTQLDASAGGMPGSFVYTPASGTVLGAGSHTLSVTFTPTDTTDYNTATAQVTLQVNQATPSITWANPSAITYGTALSSTQLDASSGGVAGSFVYTPASGTVLGAGSQTLSVTFTPTDTTDYTSATAHATLQVNQATPTITWANPSAITYGTALSSTQLDASSGGVAGSFVYTPVSGTVLGAGSQTLSVTFTPTDTTDYTNATKNVTLQVNQATPSITWPTPSAITYGTALSSTQLDASSTVGGSFVYTPASGTVLGAGSQTLSVTFTPTDTTDYSTTTVHVTLQVNQATPTITWANPSAITYGTALSSTQLDASASVGGSFVYTPASGTVLGAGSQTLSVTFTPTDTTDYSTATAHVTLQVNQATPSITWANPSAITYGTALSGTQLDASSSAAGNYAYTPASGTVLGAGSQTLSVTFTPTDTTDYTTATGHATLQVNQATPTITWATPSAITYGTALSGTQLDASSSVGGSFVYTPASGTVLGAANQTLSVTFTPTDTTDYTNATKNVTLQVNQATPTITWATPAAISYGTALSSTQLDASSSVGGSFVYTPASGTVLGAGSQTLSVTFTPTDTTDYTNATKNVTLQVNQATPTITWATPAAISYGTALSSTQLDASSTIGGSFVYIPASGTVLGAGSQTLSVTFTPTDTTDYTNATKNVTLQVNQATPTITWATPAAISYGTALSSTQLDASSGSVAGSFVYTPALGTVLGAGSQTLSVIFTPTDTTDYTNATKNVTLQVNQATPTITWATPSAISYGTALSSTQLDASSTIGGSFVYIPASGTVLGAGSQTLSVTFTPTDTTDYTSATKNVTLQINQATPSITWPTPSAISYGTALSSAQLDASSTVAGSFVYTPASGTVLGSGSQTLSVTFTPTDTTDYSTTTTHVTLQVNQATPSITWNPPSAITYGTALSSTQLDASSTLPGTFVYTPVAGTVLGGGSQTLSVTFTPTDTTDYSTTTVHVTLQVNTATPSITWNPPSAITYGTALSSTQLDASSTVPGSFVYTPAAGTVLGGGSQTLSVTFTPTDTTDYSTTTSQVTLQVNQATPSVTWATPAAITYGTALSNTQLNASSTLPGAFVYTPAAGTVLGAGSQTLSVTFTPTDTADYSATTTHVTLQVNQATPSITWAAPSAITYGTALSSTQLDASSTVAGSSVYTPATGTVLGGGSQTLSVTFTPTDTTDYSSATSHVTLQVNQATPSITWAAPSAIAYGTALSSTQLDASSTVAGTFVYTPAAGTVLGGGSQTLSVTFTPTDTTDYSSSTSQVTFQVNQASQTITFPTILNQTYGTIPFTVAASASSSLPVTFAVQSGPATISNGVVTLTGAGTVVIVATQAGSANYSATTMTQTFTVAPAPLTIAVNNATRVYGIANPNFSGTVSGALNGDVLTAAYSTSATMASSVGAYPITASISGANAGSYSVQVAPGTLTVTQAGSITSLTTSNPTSVPGASITFTAQVQSGTTGIPTGTVSFSDGSTVIGNSSLNGSAQATLTLTTLSTGTHTITATYSGDTNFTASHASGVTQLITSAAFSVSSSTPMQTLDSNGSASFVIVVSPQPSGSTLNGTVTLSATGLPPGATAVFNPPSVTPGSSNATSTMTIQNGAAFVPSAPSSHRPFLPLGVVSLAAGLLALAQLSHRGTRQRSQFPRYAVVALWILALSGVSIYVSGCGTTSSGFDGHSSAQTPGSPSSPSSPSSAAVPYTVTVIGTDGNAQQSANVTVIVP